MNADRRRLLTLLALSMTSPRARAQARPPAGDGNSQFKYAAVLPGYRMQFPQDEGSHPDFRTEWWYITGWLQREKRAGIGFQITFFRVRPELGAANPSAFTPRQIIIAHAALSDATRGKLVHDQKLSRAVFGLAGASEGRTHVWIDDWSLAQEPGVYRLRVPAREFTMDFGFKPAQPPLMQGDAGFSRKGPKPESASYYYSIPHLQVSGTLTERGERHVIDGTAWLDHEWSTTYMDEGASGWDWVAINFDDGSALMAFRMRDRKAATFWAGGAHRTASGIRRAFSPDELAFVALRSWRSPRTGAQYPVAWRVTAGNLDIVIQPLMDDQEHDTRASVGTVYWEGAVTAFVNGKRVGRGYLELTGTGRA